jgi:phosphoribosylglycinamide formyltransferase-1
MTPRLVILISGNGSNLQALLDACAGGAIPARIAAVVSNRAEAYGLERAREAGIPACVLEKARGQGRDEYDARLAELVAAHEPDWVVLAGWMRILTSAFLGKFPGRVINLHPALPGAFPGTHAIERAYAAWQAGEINKGGVMVHLVPDEGVDSGPVLGVQELAFLPQETLEEYERRVHLAEHELLVRTVCELVSPSSGV